MGFIDEIKSSAYDLYYKYGILPSISISQAILESGWGKSGLTKSANNLFGIKGVGTAGSISMNTREIVDGKEVFINQDFRAYNSWGESLSDYGELLGTKDRYKDVRSATDWKTGVSALGKSGYATDTEYVTALTGIITSNKLYEFDAEVTGNKNPSGIDALSGATPGGITIDLTKAGDAISGAIDSINPFTDTQATGEGATGFFDLAPDGWTENIGEWLKSSGFVLGGLVLLVLGGILIFGIGNAVTLVADSATGGAVSMAKEVTS